MPADKQPTARVLIIEDEPMIALSLEDVLVDAGFQIAGVAATLEKAMALIATDTCDVAIVDANLGGVSTGPAASALAVRGVPFVVMSGYSPEQLQGDFSAAPYLQKPYRSEVLVATVKSLLRKN